MIRRLNTAHCPTRSVVTARASAKPSRALFPHLADPTVTLARHRELLRQEFGAELIASENHVSPQVMAAARSPLTNKYAEGLPGSRYYGGCEHVDTVENIARERAKQLFGCKYVNVQPHSGAQANMAVEMAVLQPGDTLMGLSLSSGGHLSHGMHLNFSGLYFKIMGYEVDRTSELLDYDAIQKQVDDAPVKPKLMIAGGSAYPRNMDYARFRQIADSVGAKLMVDIAHPAGLVAAKLVPSPVGVAHIVTTTTHKTLRGPRGGMVMCDDLDTAKLLNSRVFPGVQGGPLMHIIEAKAVAFGEALDPSFKVYAQRVMDNAQVLGDVLAGGGLRLVSGGTDTHLLLVDLRGKNITGADAEKALEHAGITTNKNGIPFDPLPPKVTSGIRLGTAALSTRGMGSDEMTKLGHWILQVLDKPADTALQAEIRRGVTQLCSDFPIYPELLAEVPAELLPPGVI